VRRKVRAGPHIPKQQLQLKHLPNHRQPVSAPAPPH
jgi:hypothetical protein